MSALRGYRVRLHEEVGDRFVLHFLCEAEDADHAEEQARSAYPDAEVLLITLDDAGGAGGARGNLPRAAEVPGGQEAGMSEPVPKLGEWVKTIRDFAGVPSGTVGRVCEDDGEVLGVAWRLGGYEPSAETDVLWLVDPRAPKIRDYFRYGGGEVDETQWLVAIAPEEAVRGREADRRG